MFYSALLFLLEHIFINAIFFALSSQAEVDDVWNYAESRPVVKESLQIISKCFDTCNCDTSRFCIGFNGGKDCTVLLTLVNAVKYRKTPTSEQLVAFYAQSSDRFEELDHFVEQSVIRYNLKIIKFSASIKEALGELREQSPSIHAIFMGTRRTDLDGSIQIKAFEKTDPDWPDFLRVSPILDWSYHDVWQFLLDLKIPYCSLYDRGYSSLGSPSNTRVNPKLIAGPSNGERILPAYMLADGDDERKGRNN